MLLFINRRQNMKIDGTSANPIPVQAQKHAKQPQEQIPPEETTTGTVEAVESEDQDKGVIRLLQEGHFKGVADVRLRINFFDELQALETQALKTNASSGLDTFNGTIEDAVSALRAAEGLTKDQLAAIDAFVGNMDQIQNDFMAAGTPSIQDLISALQGEFGTLLGLFTPAPAGLPAEQPQPLAEEPEIPVEPAMAELGTEEVVPEETTPEEPILGDIVPEETTPMGTAQIPEENTIFDMFASFQERFQNALEQLQTGLTSSAGGLPEISEPSGSGTAFEKFMAIYNSMLNGEQDAPSQIDELEAVL
jgi:hypothetical protein